MTDLRYDPSFPGTDGAAWPSAYAPHTAASGGTTDLLASGMRALTGTAGGYADLAAGTLNDTAVNTAADLGCLVHWDFVNQTPLRDCGFGIFLRASNDWSFGDNPNNWVGTFIDSSGGPDIEYRNSGGTRTTVAGAAGGTVPLTPGVSNYLRFEAQGTALRARYWIGSDPAEPTTWTVQGTMASGPLTAGRFVFRVVGGSAAGVAGYARVRDIRIYDFATVTPPPPSVTGFKVSPGHGRGRRR